MRLKISLIIFVLIISGLLFNSCSTKSNKQYLHEISGFTMGTMYSIKIVDSTANKSKKEYEKISKGIRKTLKEVNRQMSTYIDTSEISQFNSYKKSDWFSVSKDFASVMRTAQKVSRKSNGYFDITVGPLVNLWGFGAKHRKSEVPADEKIKEALKKTGYEKIEVRTKPPAVKKSSLDIYCDLASIAKGFGVDKICAYLNLQNIPDYMVEIGGEVRVKGKSHSCKMWRIGISTPDNKFKIQKIVSLGAGGNLSVATSGDYRNYFEKNGVRYSHTINPKTGHPITHKLASITVVHKECMVADAYATAINVLGPEIGLELAEKEKLPVFMIIKTEDGFKEKMTPSFEKILKLNEAGKD